jgi:hypothetical protein
VPGIGLAKRIEVLFRSTKMRNRPVNSTEARAAISRA